MKRKLLCMLLISVTLLSVSCGGSISKPNVSSGDSNKESNSAIINNSDKQADCDIANNSDENTELDDSNATFIEFTGQTYENTKLAVGTDIQSGEYIAYSDVTGVLNVYNGSDLVISYTVNAGYDVYFSVSDGQTVELQNVKIANSSDVKLNSNDGVFGDGMYKIGKDIPEGSYVLKPVSTVSVYEYLSACDGKVTSMIATSKINGNITIELKEGNFLNLRGATLTKE